MNSATGKTEYLRITDLHSYYGESHILHGIDMKVDKGECVTLLGRNGSGRSTTLKSIMGLVGRRSGSIMLNGTEIINVPTHKIARHGVGFCPEERAIFSSLSTEENLTLAPIVASGGMTDDEIYEMFPNLKERRNSPGTKLSGGDQFADSRDYKTMTKKINGGFIGLADREKHINHALAVLTA